MQIRRFGVRKMEGRNGKLHLILRKVLLKVTAGERLSFSRHTLIIFMFEQNLMLSYFEP